MSRIILPTHPSARRLSILTLVLAALILTACQREASVGLPTATPVPPGGVILQPATPPPPTATPGPPTAVPVAPTAVPTAIPIVSQPTLGPTMLPPAPTDQPPPAIYPTVPPWALTPQPAPKPRPPAPCQPYGCKPPPPTGCRTYTYVVRSGDNLFRIGLRYGTTATAIARQNGIPDIRVIRPGQRLRISVCR